MVRMRLFRFFFCPLGTLYPAFLNLMEVLLYVCLGRAVSVFGDLFTFSRAVF